MSASLANHHPLEYRLTIAARFAMTSVNIQLPLVIAGRTFAIDEVPYASTAKSNAFFQDSRYRFEESPLFILS